MSSPLRYQDHLPRAALAVAAIFLILSLYYSANLLFDTGSAQAGLPEVTGITNQSTSRPALTVPKNYSQISGWHLFGTPQKKNAAATNQPVKAPETRLKLELLGIFFDKKTDEGWAIIAEQGKPHKAYKAGDKLPGNSVIQSIEADRVLLERNQRHESLSLKKLSLENH
jgi:type II secretion system protein C